MLQRENQKTGAKPSVRVARALGVTFFVVLAAVSFAYASTEWDSSRGLAMARFSGWVAVGGLALGLCVTPLSRIPRLRALSAWRRAIGIATAFASTVHVALSLFGPLDGAWQAVLTWPYLAAGALAFAVLSLLFFTSFPRIVRALRIGHWKVLHRLVYAAALFVVAHLMLSPWGSVTIKAAVSGGLVLLVLSRARSAAS
ncbi:MAG: ferric reductase-like transmembrane domain-containing protein [Polyangiales bacterium]